MSSESFRLTGILTLSKVLNLKLSSCNDSLGDDIVPAGLNSVYAVSGKLFQFYPLTTVIFKGCLSTSGKMETGTYTTAGVRDGKLSKKMSTTGSMRVRLTSEQSCSRLLRFSVAGVVPS